MPLDSDQWGNALTVLTRLAAGNPAAGGTLADAVRRGLPASLPAAVKVALEEGHPMSDVLSELAADASTSVDLLTALWGLIPADTAALRTTAANALERLTDTASLPDDPVTAVSLLADRADRLVEVGVVAASVAIARQAISRLAEPDHPTPELAVLAPNAWRVMSRCQASTGDTDGAVASARLALRLVTTMCWDAPCPEVARAHFTVASRLNAAGHDAEAREEFEAVIDMSERLLDEPAWYLLEPGTGQPANLFFRREDAVQAYALTQAGLAADWGFDPAHVVYFEPTRSTEIIHLIASALIGLCNCRNGLGDHEGAVDSAERAVALLRDLYDAEPDRHRDFLGTALTLLSEQLKLVDRQADALRAAEEAAGLLRRAVLDSGGAFVDRYARALRAVVTAAEGQATTTIGSLLDYAEELVLLYESARGTEALDRESPLVAGLTDWLEGYARVAENVGDANGALDIVDLAIRGMALVRGIYDGAEARLAVLTNLRSRLLASLGQTPEAIAAAEEAASLGEGIVRLMTLNNLAKRLADAGDLERAGQVADETLAPLDPASVTTDPSTWLLAVSLLGMVTRAHKEYSAHHVKLVREILRSAPSPPQDDAVEKNLPYIAGRAFLTAEEPAGLEIQELLAAAQKRAQLPAAIRSEYARLTYQLVCLLVDTRRLDAAVTVYRLLASVAAATGEEVPRVEQAKAATELLQVFGQDGRFDDVRAIAEESEDVLRSAEYLAARERDLGQPAAEFLAQLDQVLGR